MDNAPGWSAWDLALWKLWPDAWGGGRGHIQRYKNGWVRYHRADIVTAARRHILPPQLIAGVCWIEVGGDPTFIDDIAFAVRTFDWSGPAWTDRLTITRRPETTSFGAVSMQLRTAAATMALDATKLDRAGWERLADMLGRDTVNIDLVGRHLIQLLAHDGLGMKRPGLSMDEVRIVGARYNRGVSLALDKIRQNTSYGNLIVRFWGHFAQLVL